MPLRCYLFLHGASSSLLVGLQLVSHLHATSSRKPSLPTPSPVWVRTSSGSLALLTPSQHLAQQGAIACLLAQPSHTLHIPAKETAHWEESRGVFHSSVSGHLAQCSVIWYVSKCLTLSTAIYRGEVTSLGCGSRET